MSNETIPSDSTDNEASGSTSRGRSRAARHQDPTLLMEEEPSGSGRRRDSPSPVPYASSPFLVASAKDSSRYSIPTPPNSLSRDSIASESLLQFTSNLVSPSTAKEKGKPHYSMHLTTGALSASPIRPTSSNTTSAMSSNTTGHALTASSSQTSIDTVPSPGPGAEMQGPLSHLATVVAFVFLLYTLIS